ncbi:MAG TPA: flagellar assembly protein T N-terminal domain-containing protein [Synergistaceae bacterium]|nr:flagellar assembly protein T N-terminal domain-containing protein [Synergistaceae bacterium]
MRHSWKVLLCALCLGLFLLPLAGYAAQDITVEAEGQAPIINGDKTRARDEAKRQAYRDALEKGIGAYVEGITEMKDFQVVKDKVFSQSKGLVTDFKVTSETVEEDIFILKATCKVSVKKLDGVLGPVVIDALGNPRVMVVVDENVDGERPFLSTVEGETLRLFEKAGYLLVDPEQAKRLNQREYELARDTGDTGRLQELAKHFDADVLVYGRAQAIPYASQKVEGIRIYGVRSQLQLKAILTQTAYVVGTEKFEHKDKGTSAQDAAVKGLTICAHESSLGLVHKVAYSLVSGSAGGVPGRTVKLLVSGLSFGDARTIKSALEETRGVTAVYQRAFGNKKLELDINTEGNAEDLAVRLEELGVEVTGLTANTVEGAFVEE